MKDVTAAILIKDRKILIAKRQANDKLAGKWEFPGGKVRDNETPQQCLAREMQEEFEVQVSVGDFFAESIYCDEHQSIRLLAYRVTWPGGTFALNAHDEVRWVSLDQLQDFDFAPADIHFVEILQGKK